MFNPNPKKGGDIVLELIKRNPKKNFLLILGWANYVPLEYNFENYKNKLIILPQEDIAEIYSYTKLLLFPSQWEEALGRVQIEAAFNNIPMIGSNIGGIAECFKGNGILVDPINNIEKWQAALIKMDDPLFYQKCIKNCNKLKNYSAEEEYEKLIKLLNN